MKNYYQDGKTLDLVAPAGGVTSGVPVLIGALLVVPVISADATEVFSGLTCGVINSAKTTGQAWTQGAALYWDDSEAEFTTTAASNYRVGVAAAAALSADATGLIRLDGISTIAEEA